MLFDKSVDTRRRSDGRPKASSEQEAKIAEIAHHWRLAERKRHLAVGDRHRCETKMERDFYRHHFQQFLGNLDIFEIDELHAVDLGEGAVGLLLRCQAQVND